MQTEESEALASPEKSSPKAGSSESTDEKVESGGEDKVQSSPEKETKAAAGGKGKKAGSEKAAGEKFPILKFGLNAGQFDVDF